MASVHPKPDELEQLRSAIEPQLSTCSAATRKWCTNNTLKRYLIARSWNVAKASAMLRATLTWREQYQPESITWSEIEHNASTGRLELLDSTDSLGRPVVLMRLRNRMAPSDNEHQLRFLVYTLERACDLADQSGAEKMSWLLEMEGYSPKNSPPFAVTKSAITVLQNHYPERLGHAVLVRPPCIFNLAWNAFYPFLDKDTRSKIIFVKSGVDVVKSLKGVLDLASIDKNMGGLRNGEYDLAHYRERMIKLHSRQQSLSHR